MIIAGFITFRTDHHGSGGGINFKTVTTEFIIVLLFSTIIISDARFACRRSMISKITNDVFITFSIKGNKDKTRYI